MIDESLWVEYNPNPTGRRIGDCTVRAISAVLGTNWDTAYALLVVEGFDDKEMPSSNIVTGGVLRARGFRKVGIPNECPDCYTVSQFCKDNPTGVFMLGTGDHVVAVINGHYYDSWDSGDEVPIYVWSKTHLPTFDV